MEAFCPHRKSGVLVTGGFGEGSRGWETRRCREGLLADELAGTALTSAIPLRYNRQALPSSLLGTSSERTKSTQHSGELLRAGGGRRLAEQRLL